MDAAVPYGAGGNEQREGEKTLFLLRFDDHLVLSLQTLINGTYRMATGIAAAILSAYGMLAPSYTRLYERSAELMDGILSDSEGIHVIKAGSNVLDRPRDVGIDHRGSISRTPVSGGRRNGKPVRNSGDG